jgi:phosphate transport system permease protein
LSSGPLSHSPLRAIHGPPRLRERLGTALVWGAALLVSSLFIWLIADVLRFGAQEISWRYLTSVPLDAGRGGGIGPIIISTLLILLIAMLAATPVSLAAGIFVAEFTDPQRGVGALIGRSLDLLAAIPSIVIGLFGNAFFCVTLGLGFSILAGGLTLACMALPMMTRAVETGLRSVPPSYRDGARALGLSRCTALLHIGLPCAAPALAMGLVLGIGRALAESAALIFTSGYVTRSPESLLDSGRALAVHVFDLAMNVPGADRKAYGAALVLLVLLLIINLTARWSAKWWERRGAGE